MNTDTMLKFELNIALIPEPALASRHIAISQDIATRHNATVQLNDSNSRLALAPHLTLYQMAVPYNNLPHLLDKLAVVAANTETPDAKATEYAFNAGEASFELQYEISDLLLTWQQKVLECANSLRSGLLLDKDPAGNTLETLREKEDRLGENIRQTGYAEVGDPKHGGLFRPHVTLNWFPLGTTIDDSEDLPDATLLRGGFPMLGVYLLGPQGTCPQRLAQYTCGNGVRAK